MLKHKDMTTAAACFFEVLPAGVFSVSDAAALSGLSLPRCQLLLTQFSLEASHCGWAWVTWSGVNNLSEINPQTADEFLKEKCLSLSEKTKIRRASTLRQWHDVLKPHYRSI
ncbi:hypothetical protein [Morganella morganii]|uniref:hypothetical protein n=1 Tax=Morganella morganii TaxID=582 RepID=UPI003EB8A8BD